MTFREGFTVLDNGVKVSNKLCLECFKSGTIREGKHTDHVIPRKQGGKDAADNLQTLCATCHAKKSANEGKTL